MRVVALDPGGTTGVAIYSGGSAVVACQFEDRYELYSWLEQWSTEETIYVCESFTPRPGVRTWVPDSLFIIGYLDGRVPQWHYGSSLVMQSPAQGKAFATDEKLRKVGWWVPGQDHARDALRHLLTFLCTSSQGRSLGGKQLIEKLVAS